MGVLSLFSIDQPLGKGLNTPILNTPTAATHDWLLWTANHMQGPHQPHMIFFFQKSKILKKYFFFKNFISFFEKKIYWKNPLFKSETSFFQKISEKIPYFSYEFFYEYFFVKIKKPL